jgi:hypothetical protein
VTRVEFRLTMPKRASWDGKWSGERKNYTLTRELEDVDATKVDGRSWSYNWPDGWQARVDARIVRNGEPEVESNGFCGYDWMVRSILRFGEIYASHEEPAQ